MSHIALRVSGLKVTYGDVRAVKGISFEVRKGEIFTLIGANGAGKTSTLRAISGMLRYQGSVSYEDKDLAGKGADALVHLGMAHVPEGRGIFGNLTVEENLRLGAWVRRSRHKEVAGDIELMLTRFPRLRERWGQSAGTLSGGEQQMLAVARALMSRPSMLLLDEPSMGLAPKLVKEIYAVLAGLNAEGVTLLLIEQNANLALHLAHRAAVLETGEITIEGTSDEVRLNPRVLAAYLGA